MSKPPPPQADLDDPLNPQVNVSCLDFLLIELVPLAYRITDQLHARDQALLEAFQQSKIFHHPESPAKGLDAPTVTVTEGPPTDLSAHPGAPPSTTTAADDETREAVFWRLDGLGYRVGQGLVERFSSNKPRPLTPLDAIKFICKDLWTLVFRKQIDNLKTNHRGVFVLTDARFPPVSRMSVDRRVGPREGGEEAVRRAQTYLYFPCGVIRGALAGLGMDVTVTAETTEIPAATFQIKTKGAKA